MATEQRDPAPGFELESATAFDPSAELGRWQYTGTVAGRYVLGTRLGYAAAVQATWDASARTGAR